MNDDQQIRDLIERWIAAVDAGELSGLLAHRTDDVVMFDVPPPAEGFRGLEAYRAAWEPFTVWQRVGGGRFELVTLEVTAGTDVAFAHALLRCGTTEELAANPANLLRITFGLRREGREEGQWRVAHEHHSFPDFTAVEG
ncbi:SgcJ/EcaC family oxidoreductase [Nonomuraea sp. NPDC050310]|uniref:YybH family protein n=1 Tax=Nonomuraea sp. NPDC050310 TaxID=3154935 RepID=UPI0033D57AE0